MARAFAWLMIIAACGMGFSVSDAIDSDPFLTDIRGPLEPPFVRPSRVIEMNGAFAGQWLVAGDLDGDGAVEFVSARNDEQAVVAMSAYRLDGTMMWRWGKADGGSALIAYDVPAQIYDWDGDGAGEVFLSVKGSLIILEGSTGRETKRVVIPEGLAVADCITFANLSGGKRAGDLILKDRYQTIWAFARDFSPLWKIRDPGGFKTCHHPEPMDLDGDDRDEIMAGYTMIDPDGKPLWTLESSIIDLGKGHLDCARVVRHGMRPKDARLVLTCCGADGLLLADGKGRMIWEKSGRHFESADAGDVRPDVPGTEIVVDVDHQPYGDSPTLLFAEDGRMLGTILTNYSRHHDLVDWNGDGAMDVVLGHARAIVDGRGRRLATLAPEGAAPAPAPEGDPEPFVFVGDVTGDGREDVVLHTAERIEIYRNEAAANQKAQARIGSGENYTFY